MQPHFPYGSEPAGGQPGRARVPGPPQNPRDPRDQQWDDQPRTDHPTQSWTQRSDPRAQQPTGPQPAGPQPTGPRSTGQQPTGQPWGEPRSPQQADQGWGEPQRPSSLPPLDEQVYPSVPQRRKPVRPPVDGEPERKKAAPKPVKPQDGPTTRTKIIAGSSIAVVVLLVVAVIGLLHPEVFTGEKTTDASSAKPSGSTSAEPAPSPVLAGALGAGKAPSAAAVAAALNPLIASESLGKIVNAQVLDPTTNQVIYAHNADNPTTPASTNKILTATAVLAARGPAYRLTTKVVAGSTPGQVVIVGGGDPTLAVNATAEFPGAARLDLLAAQVKKALGGTKPTSLLIDTSLFSGPTTGRGWDTDDITGGQVSKIMALMTNGGRVKPVHNADEDDPRSSDPALSAGKAFGSYLGIPSSAVKSGKASASAAVLGSVQSPPLEQIIDWMLQQSDNTIAETMSRQVAIAAGQPADFTDSAQAVIDKLRTLGLPADEADLYDGSGLSRFDGISPNLLTQVLSLAARGTQPSITAIFGGLPVAGWSGTLTYRFTDPNVADKDARGVVRAKTGTLSGVNTIAGQLVTKDGRLLVFAVMSRESTNATKAKAALDAVLARLVQCGC